MDVHGVEFGGVTRSVWSSSLRGTVVGRKAADRQTNQMGQDDSSTFRHLLDVFCRSVCAHGHRDTRANLP